MLKWNEGKTGWIYLPSAPLLFINLMETENENNWFPPNNYVGVFLSFLYLMMF